MMNTFRMSLLSFGAMLVVPGPLVISGRAAAATEKPAPLPDAGVRTRRNPFLPNTELQRLLDSIRPAPGAPLIAAPPLEVYPEIHGPRRSGTTSLEDGAGPAVPSMRVVGFIEGYQVAALLRIGSRVETALPGHEIAYGPLRYRVDRIEPGKVVLVNRWEAGERQGVQRIEVTLSGTALRAGE